MVLIQYCNELRRLIWKAKPTMHSYRQADEFVQLAKKFKSTLAGAKNFDEIRVLWRQTHIPYKYDTEDPFSSAYRDEVMGVYSKLTQEIYTPLNELTSTKQSPEQFEVGFPWVSQNLDVIASEIAKVIQAMRALHSRNSSNRKAIEFGAGWGNLAIPLAKAGYLVSAVDIDQGFLDRISRQAAKQDLQITCLVGDFLEVSRSLKERFDSVIFQSSFHHCLDFMELLDVVRENVLTESGSIFFLSEPIAKNQPFPWGLRYDGESLWAIMCNKWLELGFDAAFFCDLMLRKGYLLSGIESIPTVIGEGWIASRGPAGVPFEQWSFSGKHSETFHSSGGVKGYGRFCREESRLPGLKGCAFSNYEILFQNYNVHGISCVINSADGAQPVIIPAGATQLVRVNANCAEIIIRSQTYVPNQTMGNGDERQLGAAIKSLSLV
jgi:2-polyprenyl-3-methyl-5-hydroxy-6-metoxy-1,4-benzoquinol methylase